MTSLYMWNLKRYDTSELIYKTEIENELTVVREKKGVKGQGIWDGQVHTAIFKWVTNMDRLYGSA